MFRTSTLAFVLVASCLLGSQDVSANVRLKNHSNETITAHVLTTEIFKDAHVNQFEFVTLKPGEQYDFITNDMVQGRTVCLFIFSPSQGGNYFEANVSLNFDTPNHCGQVVNAPYWSQGFKKVGNSYVSQAAAQADFQPIMSLLPGAKVLKAIRLVPKHSKHKALEFTYNGWHKNPTLRSW